MSKAGEIETRAAHFVMRRSEPEWSEEEARELEQWLEKSMAHKAAFWRLEHGWARADRIAALRESGERQPEPARAPLRTWLSAIAASLVVLASGAFLLQANRQASGVAGESVYATSTGAHRVIALADQTTVELNTASQLRTTLDGSKREVFLDRGEAYFDVAHDGSRPFVVHAGGQQIVVLGTRFAVRVDGAKLTVAVVEGRVRLSSVTPEAALTQQVLTPGHVAIVEDRNVLIARRSIKSIDDQLAWRNGFIRFDGATLAEVAAEFNRYHTKSIVIVDLAAGEITIGGTFQSSNVDAFIRLMQRGYGLHVEETPQEVRISRGPV